MTEPNWLDRHEVLVLHKMLVAEFGGADGVRDEGLLDSALHRPRNRHVYGEVNIPALATAYAFGIARNHPFVDGNKRTAFMAMALFLETNGYAFTASEVDATTTILALAAGEVEENALAAWVAANSKALR